MVLATLKSLLHRQVWQRLPYHWRREALFRGSARLAPRPMLAARPSLPIYVVGSFASASGLGQSARLCREALGSTGWRVEAVDVSVGLMQPADYVTDAAARLIPAGPGTILLHVNAPLVPLALLRLGRDAVQEKYIVANWAWELPHMPADWRHGVPFVHEIWMPARFGADAVRPLAGSRPVRTVPYAVASGLAAVASAARGRHEIDRPFTVLTMFSMASSFARKNPLASIAAFRAAFGDDCDVRLIVKTSRVDAYPQGIELLRSAIGGARNIEIDDRVLPPLEVDRLYAGADVVLSLHRAEGFGLLVAEAMLRGIPAIATDWSATTDFLDATCGIPVPFTLVPARDPQGTYDHPDMAWAEADVAIAANGLRRLRTDTDLRQRLGEAGRQRAKELWSAAEYARAVAGHLGLSSPTQ